LKKYSGNRKETPPVDIDTFFEYFKNLNFCEEEYSDINIDEVCNDPMYNEHTTVSDHSSEQHSLF
jgi:hypothetical protein